MTSTSPARANSKTPYDIIVIGGGPGGMMAAGIAASHGARVLLLEKNNRLGEKLLITGGGRSNITNEEYDAHVFLRNYKECAKFLYSPFSQFGVKETLDFFHERNMATITEEGGRVFPKTERAKTVWDTLCTFMDKHHVEIRTHAPVLKLHREGGLISGVELKDKTELHARAYILATGGTSHPETGSTGDGFHFLASIGHTINTPHVALVPITTKEVWSHRLSGVAWGDANVTLIVNNKIIKNETGKILFTHVGLSGPLILNMSYEIGERLRENENPILHIDLFPKYDYKGLDLMIQELFQTMPNKKLGNALVACIPKMLAHELLLLLKIDSEKFVNLVTREERTAIVKQLKTFTLTPTGLLGKHKAVVASGGLALTEVEMKTMQSQMYENLFVVGDILDIKRPSGGYSLQLCWTTGWVAGTHATSYTNTKK